MKTIINIKLIFVLFLLIGSTGMLAREANGSHLRGVTISWAPTGVTRQVEFRFLYSERGGNRVVGSAHSVGINFGDGTGGTATGVVTSVNVTDDYFVSDLKVTKTYNTCGPFTAFYSSSARIGGLRNASGTLRMETIVTPCNGNRSPVVSLPPVVTVPVSGLVQFTVPASDSDGNRLRYRLATNAESAVAQPRPVPNYTIDPNSGLISFNTAGLVPAVAAGNLFTSQIIVEDLDANGVVISKVPVDFIIKFVANVGSPPTLAINPAGPLTVAANSPVSFTVTGNDVDPNSRVTLGASGIPTGAAMSPAIGAQLSPPVTSTFNWTPTPAQAGPTGNTFVINFSATDDTNQQALKSITINVLPVGAPTANSQTISAAGGVPQNVVLTGSDPNGLALTFSITGSPGHGTAVLSGSPTCTTSGGVSTCTQNATYTATNGYSGADLFTFRVNNGVQNSNGANVNITVASNLAPTVNCPANPAPVAYASGGATVPVTFQVTDANGDALTVQWKVDGNNVQTDNVGAGNSPAGVTLSWQYAVGTHTVQVTVSDGTAAPVASCVVQITVTKANQAILFGALASKTYGDADFPVTATADSNLPVSFAASGNCTAAGGMVHITGAGSCTITASQAGNTNYNAASNVLQSFSIAKATPVISWANPADITYGTALGGTQLNASASFQSSPLNGSFAYTPLAGAILNAGNTQTLSVNFTPTDAANFNPATATVSINVLKAGLTIKADDKSRTYGDSAVSFTATPTGFVNGDTMSELGGSLAFNFADAPNKPVGTYTITPSGLTSNNYDITFQNGTLSVSKAALTVTADNSTKIYGETNPAFAAQYTGFVLGEDATALGGMLAFNTAADQTSPVGNYAVTPSGLTSNNYEIAFVAGTLQVTPAALTVKTNDESKTYGDAPVAFGVSYTGFVNGDDATDLSGMLAFDFTDTANTLAGSYTVTPSGLTSMNYNVAFASGTLTVSKAAITVAADSATRTYGAANPAFAGTLSGIRNGDNITASYSSVADASSPAGGYAITPTLADPDNKLVNYTVASTDGTLTITRAALSVVGDSYTRRYGEANPAFGGTVSGVLNNDGIAASYSSAAVPSSPIGQYQIAIALDDPNNRLSNYDVSTTERTLTIQKALLSVTAENASRLYGQTNPALTGTVTGVQNGEVITASYSTGATETSPVGSYAIVPALSGATLSNYEVTSNNGTLTIDRAALTVKADDKSKTYGGAAVPFTVSYTGFVNNETAASLSGTLAFNFADAPTTPAGAHTITPSGLSSPNYAITFASGTLTVNKAALSVTAADKTRKYGELNPQLTGTVTGILNGDNITASYSTPAVPQSNVGSYQIVPALSGAALSNYNVTYNNGTLTVTKATPIVNWINPAAILVGMPLGATQLNATASHPADGGPLAGTNRNGGFAYTPAAGTLLPPGFNTLSVVFTPADAVNYTTATKQVTQRVNYRVCTQYDQTKAHNSGSTIPIKLQLCNAAGVNLSSAGVVVNSIGTRRISATPWGDVEDAGNANPDNNFRHTGDMYMYNLQTKGLASGVYEMGFIVGADPTVYTVQFQIK